MSVDWKSGTVKVTAVLIPALAVVSAAYINLANQTAIAIEVAKQHGQELLLVRNEVAELRGAVLVNMDDRFRRADWEREEEFLIHMISELRARVEKLEIQVGGR